MKLEFSVGEEFVYLKSEGIKISLSSILYITSDGNYRHIVTRDKDIMIRSNDEELQKAVKSESMLYIRRGVWVNIHYILRFKGDYIEMEDHTKFTVSRKLKTHCYEIYLKFSL